MSCKEETEALAQAEGNWDWQRDECDRIGIENPNSPELSACQGLEESLWQQVRRARRALADCVAAATEARLLQHTGLVSFLRVQEPDYATWGGGQTNQVHSEVMFRLHNLPRRTLGFELHDDANLPARRGMLDLLRDAFINDLEVTVDYDELVQPPNHNCLAFRVWMTKIHSELPADPVFQ